jgi:hypothetical protein
VSIRVEGIEGLASLARDLKAAGEKGLTKELRAGLQRSTRPLKEAARAGALEYLPASGGLADEVAASKLTSRASLLGRNPSLKIVAAGRPNAEGRKHDLDAMDRGRLRHPLYGRRHARWYTQLVRPGWFSESLQKRAPAVRQEIEKAVGQIVDKLGR